MHKKESYNFLIKFILTFTMFFVYGSYSYAGNYQSRIGLGMSNQLNNNVASISLKLQRSRALAVGCLIGANTDENNGGYGAGVKAYRIIFDEPQLNFYAAGLAALISSKTDGESESGFQFDFTLGSEFSFSGITSLGFSFEFGVSLTKLEDFVIKTVGQNFITAAIHFYL